MNLSNLQDKTSLSFNVVLYSLKKKMPKVLARNNTYRSMSL